MEKSMAAKQRAVVTVLGKDRTGIIYHVSKVLYEHGANIVDLSQTVLAEMFNMVMLVDLLDETTPFESLSTALTALGEDIGLQVRIQRMDIFDAMHKI